MFGYTFCPMEAGTLSCPQCGAAVTSDSTECQYCHARLQTIACAKCLGMMFLGSKYCPHCGAWAAAVMPEPDKKRNCPRCDQALEDVKVADIPLEECGRCGGLWIDVTNFEHICGNAEAQQAATGLRLPPPVPLDTNVRYLKCPQCLNLMNRMNYAGRSGIVINVCRAHGVWLDRDEMVQIVTFIRSGGLDHARNVEKAKLEEARRMAEFQSIERGVFISPGSYHDSFDAAATVNLLSGIASMANHFLGMKS